MEKAARAFSPTEKIGDQKQPFILVGVPALDYIRTRTVMSLLSTTAGMQAAGRIHVQQSSVIHQARNKIAEEAVAQGYTHVMFIDSDMDFPHDGIDKLISRNVDIVGGIYYRRQPPSYPNASRVINGNLKIVEDYPNDKMFELDAIGTGFLLIKTEVFKALEAPYFAFGSYNGKTVGEDYYFCLKARKKGFKVWCDPTIWLGHVGEYTYDKKDYDAYKDSLTQKDKDDAPHNLDVMD